MPKSPALEESVEVTKLVAQVTQLMRTRLTITDVMATVIDQRIQPLRQRPHLLCEFNGTDDPSRTIQESLYDQAAFGIVLAKIYHGMAQDSTR